MAWLRVPLIMYGVSSSLICGENDFRGAQLGGGDFHLVPTGFLIAWLRRGGRVVSDERANPDLRIN